MFLGSIGDAAGATTTTFFCFDHDHPKLARMSIAVGIGPLDTGNDSMWNSFVTLEQVRRISFSGPYHSPCPCHLSYHGHDPVFLGSIGDAAGVGKIILKKNAEVGGTAVALQSLEVHVCLRRAPEATSSRSLPALSK